MSQWPPKDPDNIEPFFSIWCDIDGDNDGAKSDKGELKGATINTSTWTVPAGITEDSSNTNTVTIDETVYAVNTVATIHLSGGTAGEEYQLVNQITTSDSRTLNRTHTLLVQVEKV